MSDTPASHPGSGARRANLSRLVTLLHERGALSRAEATAATGLNRSTVGALVEALTAAGLVVESPADPSGRSGRPSPVMSVDPEVTAVAVNPEVDAVTVALVGLDRVVRRRARIVHGEPSPEDVATVVAERLQGWAPSTPPVAVGLAVPGLVDRAAGVVRSASHLGWRDVPLAAVVAEATGLPAVVGNDATLGLAAEHRFGAARGSADAIYLNGGASGIGGAIVVGGRVAGGARGYAGEFGRASVDLASPGRTLEDEVNRARLLHVLGAVDLDEAALALALAESGDPAVSAEVARQRMLLGAALANAVDLLNPSVIVLGGFLAVLADADLPGLLDAVRRTAMPEPGADVEVRTALLGDDRLLIGAADAAFAALLADPLGSSPQNRSPRFARGNGR